MALPLYLAMTAAELHSCDALPDRVAWMACHFSPYTNGLSNLPDQLPAGAMLILNDRIPPQGHVPAQIADQLNRLAETLGAERILLDFQRPADSQTAEIIRTVLDLAVCPVAVTEYYAADFSCPVFLSPPPLGSSAGDYLQPWAGREIWLEVAMDAQVVTVTTAGSQRSAAPYPDTCSPCHDDDALRCRYHMAVDPERITFTLFRTQPHWDSLLAEVQTQGVTCAVGLYQELK